MSLEQILKDINKKHGEGSIFKLSDKGLDIEVIPTGIIGLDAALGVGGLPKGRITEIFGQNGSGKSSIAVSTAIQAQKAGLNVAYVDVENALDLNLAQQMGLNLGSVFMSQPDTAEDVFDICETLFKSKEFGLVVVDSVAQLVSKREFDADFGDSVVGVLPKLMSQAMRKLVNPIAESNSVLLLINQIRDNMNAMGYAPTTITPAGHAIRFASTIRIETKRVGQIKKDELVVGHKNQANVIKNKVAPPMKKYEWEVIYGEPITLYGELIDLGIDGKIIEKAGAGWMTYGSTKLQGKDKFKQYLMENPEITAGLETKVKGWLGL